MIWTIINSALVKVFGDEPVFFRCAKVDFYLFKRNFTFIFFKHACISSLLCFSVLLPTPLNFLVSHLLIFSLDFFLFLWVQWISFNFFHFHFPSFMLSITRWLCYKFRESWLIRNMLFPLGFLALSTSLDFSNEEERSCDGHNGVCSIYFIVCPFIPQSSPVKLEEWTWELDQLGRKLEHLFHNLDRGIFFRWKVYTLFSDLSKVIFMAFLKI